MLKLLLTFLVLTVFIFSSHAQKLKKKTSSKGNYKEVYFVDKNSKLMQGPYSKIHLKTKTEVATGTFKDAMRSGLWTFKDVETNKTQLAYNFSNDSLIFIDPEQYPDSFLVQKNGSFVYDKVDRPLVFIGYKNEEKHILGTEIEIPNAIRDNGDGGTSILQFVVDEKGNIIGSKIITSYNAEIEQQISTIINSFYGRYLPAIVNAKPVKSAFYIRLNITQYEPDDLLAEIQKPFITDITIVYKATTYIKTETHSITRTSTTQIRR